MMRRFVQLRNPTTGQTRDIKVGWSWTLFFFVTWFGLPLIFRGQLALASIFVGLSLAIGVASVLENAPLTVMLALVQLIGAIWMAIKGNELTAKHYLARGWQVDDAAFAADYPAGQSIEDQIRGAQRHARSKPPAAAVSAYGLAAATPYAQPRGRGLWWKIPISVLGVLAVGFVVLVLMEAQSESSLDLEVVTNAGMVTIVNKGAGPTTISSVKINDRDDCRVLGSLFGDDGVSPQKIDVGGFVIVRSSCLMAIVRITIVSDRGSATYQFPLQ